MFDMKRILKKTNDDAMVGIVTAILLIGLIVIVISIIQVVYVPIVMEQREAEHMDRIAEQFGFLTSVIDNQAAEGRKGIPIASFITLGSKELPILVSSKAYGTLEVLENSCIITIENESQTIKYPIGTIQYSSTNAYYLDQSYTYEAGAMIVDQSQGNKMMVKPGFFADYNKTSNTVNISFDVVNISSIGLKTIAAGFGTYGIQTEYGYISSNIIINNVSNMSITTYFSNAWFTFITSSLTEEGLNSEPSSPQFTLTNIGPSIKLVFLSNLTVNISIKIIEILAQIGPGWVS
jgi:hypothetical protein